MPNAIDQATQQAALGTVLGDDVLALRSATVREALGRPFTISVEVSSQADAPLDARQLVGTNATLRLQLPGREEARYWNGQVVDLEFAGLDEGLQTYRLTIMPALYLLGRTADFMANQAATAPDMVQAVLRKHGIASLRVDLHKTYQPWDYCIQYRETDLNFVSRLMEQEGIFYFFEHADGKHTLVLTDDAASLKAASGYERLAWRPAVGGGGEEESEYVTDLTCTQTIQPDKLETRDYDFTRPRKQLSAVATGDKGHAAGNVPVFDFPGEWELDSDGEQYTRVRLEELDAQRETFHAATNARGVRAGSFLEVAEHPNPALNRKLLVTGVDIGFSNATSRSGGGPAGLVFRCDFTAIDAKTPFRTPRAAPKPVITGPQTALVVGPAGAEVHTDKFGRVKLQFHWDRYGKRDEKSSFWCRVAQAWAGKQWGAMFLPRVGMEVVVSFLGGDPDQPVVTGFLYNGDNLPPHPLPDHATMSTIKSNSSKGGAGFNELRFEDKKGSEHVFVHAEKDLHLRVKNDVHQTIAADLHLGVGASSYEHVYADRHVVVDGNEYFKTVGEWHQLTEKKWNQEVKDQYSLHVVKDVAEKFDANHHEQVGGAYYLKATSNLVLESVANITLKVGPTTIAIGPDGVKIDTPGNIEMGGTMIKAAAKAQLSLDGGPITEVKGILTQVNGSATLMLKGGIVMIN